MAPNAEPNAVHSGNTAPPHLPQAHLLHTRIRDVMLHINWYSFRPQARLARDSGVSAAVISRLIRGQSQPSLAVALRITRALSHRLGKPLDVFEVFSLDGTYPTASVCRLTGCHNCLPPEAYDAQENLRPEFNRIAAGQWSFSPSAQNGESLNRNSLEGGR